MTVWELLRWHHLSESIPFYAWVLSYTSLLLFLYCKLPKKFVKPEFVKILFEINFGKNLIEIETDLTNSEKELKICSDLGIICVTAIISIKSLSARTISFDDLISKLSSSTLNMFNFNRCISWAISCTSHMTDRDAQDLSDKATYASWILRLSEILLSFYNAQGAAFHVKSQRWHIASLRHCLFHCFEYVVMLNTLRLATFIYISVEQIPQFKLAGIFLSWYYCSSHIGPR